VVTLDVRGFLAASLPAGRPPGRRATGTPGAVQVHDGGRERTAALWARSALAPGARFAGPAVVADDGATLWIAAGWRGRVHSSGALVLERGRSR
jgi:N-methylhydantoinase A/oxoprolinase/acetone carboxylase beta subunit